MIQYARYPIKAQQGTVSRFCRAREGGRCEPFRESGGRPLELREEMPAGYHRYRKRKCASARCEFRWDHGQMLFRPEPKTGSGRFFLRAQNLGGSNEEHRKDHGEDRGPVQGPGFIFAGSEIYGGLANTWDYGPLGVELKTM